MSNWILRNIPNAIPSSISNAIPIAIPTPSLV